MHCPKCGQQQISEDVRFCSRCGFPLEGVSRLVASNGMLPVLTRAADAPTGERTARQKSMRRGSKLVFWSIALMPLIIGLSILFDSPGPLIISVILFLTGVLQILYTWLFGEDLLPGRRAAAAAAAAAVAQIGARAAERSALPPSQSAPVADPFPPRVNTAEMARPPASVTEHTTRLLDDK